MSDYNNPSAQSERITAISDYFQPKKPAWNLPKISWGDNTRLPGPQTQQLSKDFNQASEFIATLRSEGPQAAYAKYGAGDINALFDAAAGYGLIDPGERDSIWAAFNQPEPTTTGTASNTVTGGMGILGSALAPREATPATGGTMTTEMIVKAGGPMNAYDNAWAAGNMVEPQQRHFKTLADYKEYYAKWRELTH
jgi:hypothetical protein